MNFIKITNNSKLINNASGLGIKFLVDLERGSKLKRQENTTAWLSNHTINEYLKLKKEFPNELIGVRINRFSENVFEDLMTIKHSNPSFVMLPMWTTLEEVGQFKSIFYDCTNLILLAETKESLKIILNGHIHDRIFDVHFGLNDLRIEYKYKSIFEILASKILESPCKELQLKGINYGIGGVGSFSNSKNLLIDPADLLTIYKFLGAKTTILSQSFDNTHNIRQSILQIIDYTNSVEKISQIQYNSIIKKINEAIAIC